MTSADDIQVRLDVTLSQEETAFILRSLGIESLPGFEIPETFNREAAEFALRSLMARQFAAMEGETLILDERLIAVVGAGSLLKRGLSVIHTRQDGSTSPFWFYFVPDFSIFHSQPQPGLHRFQTIVSGMDMISTLAAIMELNLPNEQKSDEDAYTIPIPAYEELGAIRREHGSEAAAHFLSENNVPHSIVNALINPVMRTVISLVTIQKDQAVGDGLMVVSSVDGLRIVEVNIAEGIVVITPVIPAEVINRISQYL